MLHRLLRDLTIFLAAAISVVTATTAGVVDFAVTSLGGSSWRYNYTINNPTPSAGFDELTVYFDYSKYSNLSAGVAPSGWDLLLIQPDTGIPSDGYFDVLSLTGPLADGVSISGFSVTFDYVLGETPGAQPFDLIDSGSFTVLSSGRSIDPNASTVPEPESLALMLLGLGCAYMTRRRLNATSA